MILKYPPPASFLNLTRAKSGSIPVVSQSMTNPMVPVGAITVAWAFLNPWASPNSMARSQVSCAACRSAAGAEVGSMPFGVIVRLSYSSSLA